MTFIVAGCDKTNSVGQDQSASARSDGQSPSAAPQRANGSQTPPTTGALAPGVGTRADNSVREKVEGEVNPFLTGQLQLFVQQKGRLPQSFTEFVNARLDSVPRPPAGKRWAIDRGSTEIKAINAH
jgi:hypothetical protein